MHILVIGAGVIGLTTAWRLARDGHRVTVLDEAPGPGLGTSRANGGQLSYSYVAPLAGPAIWRDLPRLVFGGDAPVRLRLGLDPFQYRWCLQFLAACTARQVHATTATLLKLAALSRDVLHEARELHALDFAWTQHGKLVVYSDARSLAAAQTRADFQNALGSRQQILTRDECLAREPALASIAGRLVGGVFTSDDEAADPYRLCTGLAAWLAAHGTSFVHGVHVQRLLRAGPRLVGVETDRGVYEADAYVLAAGLASRELARGAGLDLPIYPIKGYSLSVDIADKAAAPTVSLTDHAQRIVYARLGETLRIAGMADIVGGDRRIDPSRLAQLVRQAQAAFPQASDYRRLRPWTGLRPATPTGVPILGRSGLDNLFLNVGHGALGLTLAFGSADAVAVAIGGKTGRAALARAA